MYKATAKKPATVKVTNKKYTTLWSKDSGTVEACCIFPL